MINSNTSIIKICFNDQLFTVFPKKFSFIKDKRRQKYAAMVTSLDESVGAVKQALADKGMLQDSVIIFTTDNGGAPYGFNW